MTGARAMSSGRLARAALPIVAVLVFAFGLASTLAVAGKTLGYDFLAYHQAAVRLLHGQPLYDMSYTQTGGFGLFYYPPTFAPLVLPFGLLSATTATWTWITLLVASFLVGVLILPVSRTVRWWLILLAGLSFPFVYAVKLGQVGPLLFLLFAIGWRWMDRPARLGTSAALGAAVKIQPGLILVWALLTRRWRAVVIGAAVLGVLAVAATLLAGMASWSDFLTLVRTVSDPITTEHNFTPGAVAYQLGVPASVASAIQLASTVLAILALLAAIRWIPDEASYLVAVVVSQLVSPVLWDHYAMLLLLPVAYLLSAGRYWALLIPLSTSWLLVGVTPPVVYPVVFWVTLGAVLWVGRKARLASEPAAPEATPAPAATAA
jgi:alpha-1,2-mannosyltransferase